MLNAVALQRLLAVEANPTESNDRVFLRTYQNRGTAVNFSRELTFTGHTSSVRSCPWTICCAQKMQGLI
jgi:hypothetical protein